MIEKKLRYMEYINRENDFRHFHFETEMKQYELIMNGSPEAAEEGSRVFSSDMNGRLSKDELRHYKYLFVAAAALAARYAIKGGMDTERAYNASDIYINRVDLLNDVEKIKELHREMFRFYSSEVAAAGNREIYSKHVLLAADYIYYHLHEQISVKDIAEDAGLNANYLSGLFHRETGMKISDYITRRKIEAAENMLRFSDYSISEISSILAFSTQSYFSKVFRSIAGMSPGEYRHRYFRTENK